MMKEKRKFEKYQDFLNKRKIKQEKQNYNSIKDENETEPCSFVDNKHSKNIIQSYISEIKKQMNIKNNNNDKIRNTENNNLKMKNKEKSLKIRNKVINKMNFTSYNNKNNIIKDQKEEKKIASDKKIKKYQDRIYNSDMIKNRTENKIRNYSNNYFTENKNNMRYNFSSDYLPNDKELDHILSSYDFKNNNDIGDLNTSTKIQFRNLLSLVRELKAKNELMKKELRNKENLISSLEKINFNKNKNEIKNDKNMNNIMMNEYNDNLLLDNQKLKSEILNLNKELENQKIYYEDVIKDYKLKLEQEKYKNNITEDNYKEIENRYKYSNEQIFNIEKDYRDAVVEKAKLRDLNSKYEIINSNQQKRIENLENQLNVILSFVKDLFNKENDLLYPMRNKLFYEISNLNNIYLIIIYFLNNAFKKIF